MKNVAFSFLIIFLIFSACNSNTADNQTGHAQDTTGTPRIEFQEKKFDFGKLNRGESVSHTFTFTNTGNADLVITNANASCGCTVPKYSKEPISPGEQGSIEIVFNSSGFRGNQYKTIRVYSNAKTRSKKLKIAAFVKAPEPVKTN